MRIVRLTMIMVFLICYAGTRAEAQPMLQLDTGGHQSVIRNLTFTPDGKFIVSAGDDKVIRIWDWRLGKTIRTIRGQSGPGDEGKIFAVALSPDGRWLAVGGWLGKSKNRSDCCGDIRIFDFPTGKLKALLKGHTSRVIALAFSPQGDRLVSGGRDSTAIIWDLESQSAIYRLRGHRDDVYSVGFTPDGSRVVTGSYDKTLRLWNAENGLLLKEMAGHTDRIRSISISGLSIASADKNGEIRLWHSMTGALLKVLPQKSGEIIRFSPNGRLLLSSCGSSSCADNQHVYDVTSGKKLMSYEKLGSSVIALAFSPDGKLVATGGGDNHEIHVWDPTTGETKAVLRGVGAPVWAVGFSADANLIAWGNTRDYRGHNARGPLETALNLHSIALITSKAEPIKSDESWVRAQTRIGALSLTCRKGGALGYEDAILDILLNAKGSKIPIQRGLSDGERHRAYSFSPDGKKIISGGSWGVISAYGLDGGKLGEFVGHEGDIWAIAVSPDGKYLVSGSDDQTVRLWNLKTRELLVSLFSNANEDWIAWTPQGFYAGVPGTAEMVGWQVNHGLDHEADYVTAAQLRRHLNRPDIVARSIRLGSAKAAAEEAMGADFKLDNLLNKPAPRLRILSPESDVPQRGGHSEVTLDLEATPDPVKVIHIQVNGRQIADEMPPEGRGGFDAGKLTFRVPLAKGVNKVSISAVNETGETIASVNLIHEGDGDLDKRGTLYILAIGVDNYQALGNTCGDDGKQSCDLHFAGADARAFAETMGIRSGPLHEHVQTHVLVNGPRPSDSPTAANILDALELLRGAMENDTVMMFVSGHGINDGPNYRFVPTDANYTEGGYLRQSSVVPWYAFQEALTSAKGRRLLFLDTCHSANAFNQKLLSDSYETNIVVYSSARWDQLALEDDALGGGHGLFAYALVEGINGAARDVAGEIRIESLREYLHRRVTALAAKFLRAQEPQYFRARDADNYMLARVR